MFCIFMQVFLFISNGFVSVRNGLVFVQTTSFVLTNVQLTAGAVLPTSNCRFASMVPGLPRPMESKTESTSTLFAGVAGLDVKIELPDDPQELQQMVLKLQDRFGCELSSTYELFDSFLCELHR